MGVTKEERERRLADIQVMSDEEFAVKYKVTAEWAKKLRAKHGIYRPKVLLIDKIPEDVKIRICELRREGKCFKEISIETKISDWGVREVLHANGFEVNRFKGKKKKQHGHKVVLAGRSTTQYITPENATPYYYGDKPDTFELNPQDRQRLEELRRWKEERYRQNCIEYERRTRLENESDEDTEEEYYIKKWENEVKLKKIPF